MLRNNISTATCKRIIVYPYERNEEVNVRFCDFAESCSREYGGTSNEWMQTNKHVLGFFGSKKKKLQQGEKFRFPKNLIQDAIERWFESVGIPRTPSPESDSSPESQV